jgi:uncharacterized membrane protein (UPF0136 family)
MVRRKGGGLGSDAFDAAAGLGRIMSYISLIVGVLVGIAFIVIGALVMRKPAVLDKLEKAPSSTSTSTLSPFLSGVIFIALGLLAVVGSIFWFFVVKSNKTAAAAAGAADVFNFF